MTLAARVPGPAPNAQIPGESADVTVSAPVATGPYGVPDDVSIVQVHPRREAGITADRRRSLPVSPVVGLDQQEGWRAVSGRRRRSRLLASAVIEWPTGRLCGASRCQNSPGSPHPLDQLVVASRRGKIAQQAKLGKSFDDKTRGLGGCYSCADQGDSVAMIGYARVSTRESQQVFDRQAGVHV
jgi:hypothetical protein